MMRELCIAEAKKAVRDSVTNDTLIVQAISSIEELDKITNQIATRVREWYSWYNPEFSRQLSNNEKFIESLKTYRIKQDTFMHVGTIMGITGLMVALAEVNAAALLIETSAYPGYIGLDASKQLLKLLKKMFDFNIKFNNLNKELKLIQKLRDEAFLSQKESHKKGEEPNYIG